MAKPVCPWCGPGPLVLRLGRTVDPGGDAWRCWGCGAWFTATRGDPPTTDPTPEEARREGGMATDDDRRG